MKIAVKNKSEIKAQLLEELKKFKKECANMSFTNVTLNKHITNIIQKYVEPHEPVRSSFEYQLFLSAYRNTPTYTRCMN